MIFDRLKPKNKVVATATVTTLATDSRLSVATVAGVAVANPQKVEEPLQKKGIFLDSGEVATATLARVATLEQAGKACLWLVKFADRELSTAYVPAVDVARVRADHPRATGARINQGCSGCVWNLRPGITETGYCTSPDRHDQPGPYGVGHPARFLPEGGGEACELFEGAQFE